MSGARAAAPEIEPGLSAPERGPRVHAPFGRRLCEVTATETIDRCAETFVSLPVEIHLGPEQVLYKFEEAKFSTLGPVASLQLTRRPLTRREIIEKRIFDLVCAAGALILVTPFLIFVAIMIKLDSGARSSSCSGVMVSTSSRSASSSFAPCGRSTTGR